MVSFEFATAARLLFGSGKLAEVPAALRAQGVRRALVATNLPGAGCERLRSMLAAAGIESDVLLVGQEPTVDSVSAGRARTRREGCDALVGLGGGSAMDTAKAVAALATNEGELMDYLEVVGRGRTLEMRPLPFVAIPTTAGSGAEVTRNAVIGVPAAKVKVSLRSQFLLPILTVLDPDLLDGLPRPVVACSGLDALSHLVEALVSSRANPLTDALGAEGLRHSARAPSLHLGTGGGRARGPDAGEPMRRSVPGQRRSGRGARLRGSPGWDGARSPWSSLRGLAGSRDGGQPAGLSRARARTSGSGSLSRDRRDRHGTARRRCG